MGESALETAAANDINDILHEALLCLVVSIQRGRSWEVKAGTGSP